MGRFSALCLLGVFTLISGCMFLVICWFWGFSIRTFFLCGLGVTNDILISRAETLFCAEEDIFLIIKVFLRENDPF